MLPWQVLEGMAELDFAFNLEEGISLARSKDLLPPPYCKEEITAWGFPTHSAFHQKHQALLIIREDSLRLREAAAHGPCISELIRQTHTLQIAHTVPVLKWGNSMQMNS